MVLVVYLLILPDLPTGTGDVKVGASVVGGANEPFVPNILNGDHHSGILGKIFREEAGLGGHDDLCGCSQ